MSESGNTEVDGIDLVDRYAVKAVRSSEERYGPFPRFCDHEDVVQTVHQCLCKSLGNDYATRIGRVAGPSFRGSAEHRALRRAAGKAIRM